MKQPRYGNIAVTFIIISLFLLSGWLTSCALWQYELNQSYRREDRLFRVVGEMNGISKEMEIFRKDVTWVKRSNLNGRVQSLECKDHASHGRNIPQSIRTLCNAM